VWPLGIIGEALTETNASTVDNLITMLAETDSEAGLLHESFYPDGYWKFTRQEFGWANALYAELVFRTVAGYETTPFIRNGVILPFQRRTQTPTLVPIEEQLQNSATLVSTLGRLLYAGRDAAINQ
jgi:hypothetical protein